MCSFLIINCLHNFLWVNEDEKIENIMFVKNNSSEDNLIKRDDYKMNKNLMKDNHDLDIDNYIIVIDEFDKLK
jgi:hypothetical protein